MKVFLPKNLKLMKQQIIYGDEKQKIAKNVNQMMNIFVKFVN